MRERAKVAKRDGYKRISGRCLGEMYRGRVVSRLHSGQAHSVNLAPGVGGTVYAKPNRVRSTGRSLWEEAEALRRKVSRHLSNLEFDKQ